MTFVGFARLRQDHDLLVFRTRTDCIQFLRLCMSGQNMTSSGLYFQPKGLSADKFDRLLEILSQAAHLLASLQQKSPSGRLDINMTNTLLQQSVHTEGQLLTWFHELQSEEGSQPLSFSQNMSIDTLESPQETMHFTNPSSIPLLALYWLGLVAVYASMTKTLRILVRTEDEQARAKSLKQRLEIAESLSYRFVNRLSHCHAGCVGMGQGTTILLMATSMAAQQICRNSQDDSIIVDN